MLSLFRIAKLVPAAALVFGGCGGKTLGADAGDGGGDEATCTYQDTRTASERVCNVASDCVVVARSMSCCQQEEEGIRADAAQQFQTQQSALTAGCAACGCDAQPVDELGLQGTNFTVACDNGACTAHVQ